MERAIPSVRWRTKFLLFQAFKFKQRKWFYFSILAPSCSLSPFLPSSLYFLCRPQTPTAAHTHTQMYFLCRFAWLLRVIICSSSTSMHSSEWSGYSCGLHICKRGSHFLPLAVSHHPCTSHSRYTLYVYIVDEHFQSTSSCVRVCDVRVMWCVWCSIRNGRWYPWSDVLLLAHVGDTCLCAIIKWNGFTEPFIIFLLLLLPHIHTHTHMENLCTSTLIRHTHPLVRNFSRVVAMTKRKWKI